MTRRIPSLAWLAGVAVALSGCALLSKSEPMVPRYFTPEVDAGAAQGLQGPTNASTAEADRRPLRIGRVEASSQLRERIVYRTSAEESSFYQAARWTERPENYLRRALSRALFEERPFARAVSGAAPMLEAELVAFEEVRGPTGGRVRVQVVVTLDDERLTRLEQTFTIEQPLPVVAHGARPAAVARTLGTALRQAVERIAEQVVAALAVGAPAGGAPTVGAPALGEARLSPPEGSSGDAR